MTQPLQAIRGMNDILPGEIHYWHSLEKTLRELFASYGYNEIRPNLMERTEVFTRSIGAATDIVTKEMYTFTDRHGESLTLRPEGTAGCVRAVIEHHLSHRQTQRLWMMGPMFRYERPQKGRYRQFHQVAAEIYGLEGPDVDAELILLTARLWQITGVSKTVQLQLNSLGNSESREHYRQALQAYFQGHYARLDEESQKRLTTNPLRILDSKNPDLQLLIKEAPQILECLDAGSKQHFEELQNTLRQAGVSFVINPRLVRGLDYYDRTVFEWVTEELGAQGAVCGGGRYNGLVELLGGNPTPAIGFAIGLERLIEILKLNAEPTPEVVDVYVVSLGEGTRKAALVLAETLRSQKPSLKVLTHLGEGGFKQQLRQADKSGAKFALILGDEELAKQQVTVKSLRKDEPQRTVNQKELLEIL